MMLLCTFRRFLSYVFVSMQSAARFEDDGGAWMRKLGNLAAAGAITPRAECKHRNALYVAAAVSQVWMQTDDGKTCLKLATSASLGALRAAKTNVADSRLKCMASTLVGRAAQLRFLHPRPPPRLQDWGRKNKPDACPGVPRQYPACLLSVAYPLPRN